MIEYRRSDLVLIVAAMGLAALSTVVPLVVAVALGIAVLAATWRWPSEALRASSVLVLTVRPALDIFGERTAGMSLAALNPAVVFGIGILGIGGVLGWRRIQDGRSLWPDVKLFHAHLWLLTAYIVGTLAGTLYYGRPGLATGLRDGVRMASIVAAFLLVIWWVEEDDKRVRQGWWLLLLGMVAPLVMSLWQGATGRGLAEEGFNRLRGTFSHPNSLGPYLAPFILLAVGMFGALRGFGRVMVLAATAGLAWIVAMTYSRTGTLVVVIGLGTLAILRVQRFGIREMGRALAVISVFLVGAWALFGNAIRERFAGLSIGSDAWVVAQMGMSENSFTWRLINWLVLVTLGLDHPIIGHGVGMTTVLNPMISTVNGVPYNAHNDFVRWFFEGGAVGLFCYTAYGVVLCVWAVRRARRSPLETAASAYAVAASLLTMFFLTGGTPEMSLQTAIQYEIYGMLALLAFSGVSSVPMGPPVAVHMNATDRRDP